MDARPRAQRPKRKSRPRRRDRAETRRYSRMRTVEFAAETKPAPEKGLSEAEEQKAGGEVKRKDVRDLGKR